MELIKAEEILSLAASAESGVRVEFLTKPKQIEAFVFIAPRSLESIQLCTKLLIVHQQERGQPKSIRSTYATPADALDRLSKSILPSYRQTGIVAPDFYHLMEKMLAACEHDTFFAALRRVRDADY